MSAIETDRLRLRAFSAADAKAVQQLANDATLARYTALLPHPYALSDAQSWIAGHAAAAAQGKGKPWAMVRKADDVLLGAISLECVPKDALGTLGYWVGRVHWGCGYASEAAQGVVAWGFAQGLEKIAAEVIADNVASITVLQRCGLSLEGILKAHVKREGRRLDLCCYGRLRVPLP